MQSLAQPSLDRNVIESVSSSILYRRAKNADLPIIAANLRQADQYEILLASNLGALAGLKASHQNAAESWVACAAERPIAIFGVTTWQQHPQFGLVWLLGTTGVGRFRKVLVGDGSRWLAHFERPYSAVGNWVYRRNFTAIRWLQQLGFDFPGNSGFDRGEMLFFRKQASGEMQ